jgi:hypothetical protein
VGLVCQRGRERKLGTGSGFGFLGRMPDLELGQMVSPGPFYFYFLLFFLFLFCFLISFRTFALWLQIDSNQFLKFSKNPHIILNQ